MPSRTAVTTLDGALGDMQISQLPGSKPVRQSFNLNIDHSVLTITENPSVKAGNTFSVTSYTATHLMCLYGKCVNSDHRGSVLHYRQGKETVLSSKVLRPVLGPTCVILNGYRR